MLTASLLCAYLVRLSCRFLVPQHDVMAQQHQLPVGAIRPRTRKIMAVDLHCRYSLRD